MQSPTINTIGKRKAIFHDLETFSEARLPIVGSSRYSRHESTDILLCAYGIDDEPVKQWIPAQGEDMPAELEDSLADDRIKKVAFNKSFEDAIWKNVQGIVVPEECWRDPMIMALACSLPEKLGRLCKALNISLGESKTNGSALIKHFCMPTGGRQNHWHENKPFWERMLQYNKRDVIAMRRAYKILSNYDLSDEEWQMWHIDQQINQAGIPIDTEMATRAVQMFDMARASMKKEIRRITGLKNPKDTTGILRWLEKEGHQLDSLLANKMDNNLAQLYDEGATPADSSVKVLQMYRQIMRTAPTKYKDMMNAVDDDGRARNCYQFRGAHTGRWSGHGLQPQNLSGPTQGMDKIVWDTSPAGHKVVKTSGQTLAAEHVKMFNYTGFNNIYPQSIDALTSAVRPAIKAPDGHVFIAVDLNYIEVVVLGWLFDDKNILSIIKEGKDPYIAFATDLYDQSYDDLLEEYKAGDHSKRRIAKPPTLGCGFMLSAGKRYDSGKTTALIAYAENMGVVMTEEQAEHAVKTYRMTNTDVVQGWRHLELSAKQCVDTKQPVSCGKVSFDIKGNFMRIKLPSGRFLYYHSPKIEFAETKWGVARKTLTYEQNWYKPDTRVSVHPGKLTQHIVSGIACDLFSNGMRLTHQGGIEIVMHSHDELVGLVKEEAADAGLSFMLKSMCAKPSWWGNVPITADGYISNRYIKG